MSWEALHSGPWHSVPTAWREIHSLAAIASAVQTLKEVHHSSQDSSFKMSIDFRPCLKSLDVALLVGGPRLARLIHPLMDHLHSRSTQHPEDCPRMRSDQVDPDHGQSHIWLDTALQPHEIEAWRATFTQEFGDRCSWLEALEAPGLMQFEEQYMVQQQPVLLEGVADAWPALHRHVPGICTALADFESRSCPGCQCLSMACHRPYLVRRLPDSSLLRLLSFVDACTHDSSAVVSIHSCTLNAEVL